MQLYLSASLSMTNLKSKVQNIEMSSVFDSSLISVNYMSYFTFPTYGYFFNFWN
jgi:hypothetical protein